MFLDSIKDGISRQWSLLSPGQLLLIVGFNSSIVKHCHQVFNLIYWNLGSSVIPQLFMVFGFLVSFFRTVDKLWVIFQVQFIRKRRGNTLVDATIQLLQELQVVSILLSVGDLVHVGRDVWRDKQLLQLLNVVADVDPAPGAVDPGPRLRAVRVKVEDPAGLQPVPHQGSPGSLELVWGGAVTAGGRGHGTVHTKPRVSILCAWSSCL